MGYMREAVTAIINFAFETMDLQRIEADVDPRNDRSLRLLEKIGCQREGYLRERWRVSGEIQDSLILGLLRREWTETTGILIRRCVTAPVKTPIYPLSNVDWRLARRAQLNFFRYGPTL